MNSKFLFLGKPDLYTPEQTTLKFSGGISGSSGGGGACGSVYSAGPGLAGEGVGGVGCADKMSWRKGGMVIEVVSSCWR